MFPPGNKLNRDPLARNLKQCSSSWYLHNCHAVARALSLQRQKKKFLSSPCRNVVRYYTFPHFPCPRHPLASSSSCSSFSASSSSSILFYSSSSSFSYRRLPVLPSFSKRATPASPSILSRALPPFSCVPLPDSCTLPSFNYLHADW